MTRPRALHLLRKLHQVVLPTSCSSSCDCERSITAVRNYSIHFNPAPRSRCMSVPLFCPEYRHAHHVLTEPLPCQDNNLVQGARILLTDLEIHLRGYQLSRSGMTSTRHGGSSPTDMPQLYKMSPRNRGHSE
jgi:hypothetical protein